MTPPPMHAGPEAIIGKSPGSEEAERWSRARPYQGTIVAINSLCQLSSADDKVRTLPEHSCPLMCQVNRGSSRAHGQRLAGCHKYARMLAGRQAADACGVLALTARHGSCMCETPWVCSISHW